MMSLMVFFLSFFFDWLEEISIYRVINEIVSFISFWLAPIDWRSDNLLRSIIDLSSYSFTR